MDKSVRKIIDSGLVFISYEEMMNAFIEAKRIYANPLRAECRPPVEIYAKLRRQLSGR